MVSSMPGVSENKDRIILINERWIAEKNLLWKWIFQIITSFCVPSFIANQLFKNFLKLISKKLSLKIYSLGDDQISKLIETNEKMNNIKEVFLLSLLFLR